MVISMVYHDLELNMIFDGWNKGYFAVVTMDYCELKLDMSFGGG